MNPKPMICTFLQLQCALQGLHRWQKPLVDDLHDVWLKGAPTPDSRILQPRGYDPRKAQAGNMEKRIVLPAQLEAWVQQTGARRGVQMTLADAQKLVKAVQQAWGGSPPRG